MPMVDRSEWQATADLLSRALHGQPARLEIAAKSLGDQVDAEWTPLLGLTYDPKDDIFEIQLRGVDHLVRRPAQFAIRERYEMLESLLVRDAAGTEHIVQLLEPIPLPPTPV